MQTAIAIDEMSGSQLLDHVDDLAATQRRCEVEILRAAAQHAYLHDPESLDPVRVGQPGRERARRFGGDGTPEVTEFAAAELGARLGLSTYSAHELMSDALDVAHRLPMLWARVQRLEVRAYLARFVARKTRDLTAEQAAYVDQRVAESADGRLSWTRFQTLVEAAVQAADPETAAARERAAADQQVATPTHSDDHGMRGFYIRAPFATIAVFDAALARLAQILADLGDTDSLDQRRVKALLILARPDVAAELIAAYQAWRDRPADPGSPEDADSPAGATAEPERTGPEPVVDWSTLLPAVTVYVHLYGGLDSDGIARVEDLGPVTETWVRDHLGARARFTIRPILDIEGQAPIDAYEVPDRHRQAVHLMTPADTFPYSSSLSRSHQIDHTEPYRHGPTSIGAGQSRLGNYGPMSTPHHRLKTFGRWKVKQPFPGIYVWCDPHGAIYLVDHTGTRRVDRTA